MHDPASRLSRWFEALNPLPLFSALARVVFGQRIAAVMTVTWKAAFRFRLFLVISVLLLGCVVLLP